MYWRLPRSSFSKFGNVFVIENGVNVAPVVSLPK